MADATSRRTEMELIDFVHKLTEMLKVANEKIERLEAQPAKDAQPTNTESKLSVAQPSNGGRYSSIDSMLTAAAEDEHKEQVEKVFEALKQIRKFQNAPFPCTACDHGGDDRCYLSGHFDWCTEHGSRRSEDEPSLCIDKYSVKGDPSACLPFQCKLIGAIAGNFQK